MTATRTPRTPVGWETVAIATILAVCVAANIVIAAARPAMTRAALASVDSTLSDDRAQLRRDLDEWRHGMINDGRWVAELASLIIAGAPRAADDLSEATRERFEALTVGQIPTARVWLVHRDGRRRALVGSEALTPRHRWLVDASLRRDTTVIAVTEPLDRNLRIGVASPVPRTAAGWTTVLDVSATERLRRRIPKLTIAGQPGVIALTFPFGDGYVATTWLRDSMGPTVTWPKTGWALTDASLLMRGGELADSTARFQLAVPRAAALAIASNRVAWMHATTALIAMPLCVALLLVGRAGRNARLRRTELSLAESQLRTAQAESAATHASLAAIQARLHPHFLANALHSASALIGQDPEAAEEALDRLGSLFRYTLESSERQTVRLTDEWRFVRDYLEIEQLRLGNRLRVQLHLDESIAGCEVPAFVLQPLVENAVRHGIGPQRNGGTIKVSATPAGHDIHLVVSDDGLGAAQSALDVTKGTGLRTLRERLALDERWRGAVSIDAEPNVGFTVRVQLARIDGSAPAESPIRSRTSSYT